MYVILLASYRQYIVQACHAYQKNQDTPPPHIVRINN
jgi:hypothetical protein